MILTELSLQVDLCWLNKQLFLCGDYQFQFLSCVPDLVNGALNKLLVNRTPTNTPKSEEMGRY